MRVVADTNVLISGLLWRGPPHTLVDQARTGAFVLVSSPTLVAEFDRVIRRPKFHAILGQAAAESRLLASELRRWIEIVDAAPLASLTSRDRDDDAVLAAAVAGKANLIVSGDRDLLSLNVYRRIPIVTPAEAVRLMAR